MGNMMPVFGVVTMVAMMIIVIAKTALDNHKRMLRTDLPEHRKEYDAQMARSTCVMVVFTGGAFIVPVLAYLGVIPTQYGNYGLYFGLPVGFIVLIAMGAYSERYMTDRPEEKERDRRESERLDR